jgi:hypothetical protein
MLHLKYISEGREMRVALAPIACHCDGTARMEATECRRVLVIRSGFDARRHVRWCASSPRMIPRRAFIAAPYRPTSEGFGSVFVTPGRRPEAVWTGYVLPGAAGRSNLRHILQGSRVPGVGCCRLQRPFSCCAGGGWQAVALRRPEGGPRARTGPAASPVVAWEIEREAYDAIPVMSDGTR